MNKKFTITFGCVIAFCLIALLGVRRDHRHPNQHLGRYWAVRELDAWSFFGVEIYARCKIAVYDMNDRTTDNLPAAINAPSVQIRRFGQIVRGDRQFNLGELSYQR